MPIGILLGKIRRGVMSGTQWAGTGATYKGQVIPTYNAPRIECYGFWRVFDIPDEPSLGQYEPTVDKIYRRLGWVPTVIYQLCMRNVGHGWPYRHAWRPIDPPMTEDGYVKIIPVALTVRKFFGLYYGWRPYADWRNHPLAITRAEPEKFLSYYYVPGVWRKVDWA